MIRSFAPDRSPNRKILLVDREHELLGALIVKLKKAGFDTLTARRGTDALAIAATESLAMAIIDPRLQDMNGATLGAMLRSKHNVPFLFLTQRSTQTYERAAMEAGAMNILSKASHPADLVTQVQLAIRHAVEMASAQKMNERLTRKVNGNGHQEMLIGCMMEKWGMDKSRVKSTLNQFVRSRAISMEDLAAIHASTQEKMSELTQEFNRRLKEVQPEVLVELNIFRDRTLQPPKAADSRAAE